jgi:hypothetical protein
MVLNGPVIQTAQVMSKKLPVKGPVFQLGKSLW